MTNLKHTKKALLSSIIALVLCFAMLLGTTYAWFTDSATSSGNKIQAGTLDVDLYLWGETGATEITDASEPIFGVNTKALDGTNTLWEPGKTQTVYLSIKNNGNLDLKYKVALDVSNATNDLEDYMEYAITPDAKYGKSVEWAGGQKVVANRTNATQANNVPLKAGEEHFFALSVHMDELATNEQMGGTIDFDIKVLAGQLASEGDSFGSDYDFGAGYDGYSEAPAPAAGVSALEIPVYNSSKNDDVAGSNVGNKDKIGSATIPADAIDPNAETVGVQIEETEYDIPGVDIVAGTSKITYNVNVEGLKANNNVPVKVELRIPTGLDKSAIKLYHYGEEITVFNYKHETGMVTFEATSFSPFSVIYDLNKKYQAPTSESVEEAKEYYSSLQGNVASEYTPTEPIEWGSYGQWSPTEGLDAELEAIYKFKSPETFEQAQASKLANWHCDFYVKLDRDLGENQIFLGGNYGSFGWVGFHNGDLTLEANTEIPLLGSVTNNPWTYVDVVNFVGEFICGVGAVSTVNENGETVTPLEGATFTVMLRLTNPENSNDYINVETITYKFQ